MVCKFEYNGKTYDQDGLAKALEEMHPSEAHKYINGIQNIPNAPFKKTWDELALKRVLQEAVDKGYDSVSWTPGEAQAARYDLSKQVDRIQWRPSSIEDRYLVEIHPKNGSTLKLQVNKNGNVEGGFPSNTNQFEGKKLSDVIGKEHADKILSEASGNLEGDGLKIGGEGMKAFYDKMLVDKANSLLKKMGGKVEYSTDVVYPKLSNKIGEKPEEMRIPIIKITPQMREQIKSKGFPLYSSGIPTFTAVDDPNQKKLIPIDHNPFQPKLTPIPGNPFTADIEPNA